MQRKTAIGAALSGLGIYLAVSHTAPMLVWIALVPLFLVPESQRHHHHKKNLSFYETEHDYRPRGLRVPLQLIDTSISPYDRPPAFGDPVGSHGDGQDGWQLVKVLLQ
jgi:hypothetical protein